MRICKDIKTGLSSGFFMGYAVSANWTLNATDAELLAGGSLQCIVAMLALTAIGAFVGFANSIRRDARENIPDEIDRTILTVYLFALTYLYITTPTFSEVLTDLKERWDNNFKLQP